MNAPLRPAAAAPGSSNPWPPVAVPLPESLSERERQLVLLLARGLPVKQIAAHLGTRVQTVSNQLTSLYRKLGAQGRFDALVLLGFVTHPAPLPPAPPAEPATVPSSRDSRNTKKPTHRS